MFTFIKNKTLLKSLVMAVSTLGVFSSSVNADVTLESEVKITDHGLHFDGKKLTYGTVDQADTGEKYDYFFGRNISAHGDAVKTFKHYVFMTWYKGGKDVRNMMLSRYNTLTGTVVTVEFPHRHTGFRGDPLIGESHNTIGLAVSPLNGTIHMVFDMHAYDDNNHDGKFKDDFFRYTYSIKGAAELPDNEFTLDKFVKDTSTVSQGPDDYKHLTMTGNLADKSNFARLTYPKFFATDEGTLLLYMRLGGNNNGAYVFNRYDAENQTWSKFTKFNENNQKSKGNDYNWGLYGNMKYVNGKLRVGFQQRSSDNTDKYKYQNGVYYAYSDHPEGFGDWKNHKGEPMTWPLINSDEIKVFEPGDYITHEQPYSVYIVGSFDWTVTEKGDIHIVSLVKTNTSSADAEKYGFEGIPKETVYIHSYKPAGAEEFIHSTDFVGASSIYTAGDNIYIAGLRNGRPYIEKAKGGTNDFVRVYEATEGPQYDHGTIYINDGKVYYYLMEKGAGTALPLHLQIIDLDIEGDANAPQVAFPSTSMTVAEGYEKLALTVNATSPVEGRTIQSVALYIDDELVRTDSTVPYLFGHGSKPHETGAMGWLDNHSPNPNPFGPGTYLFKAVATDSEGDTGVASMQLTVKSNGPVVEFPNNSLELEEGFEQLGFTISASSPVEDRTIDSVTLYLNDELVRVDTSFPYVFGHKHKPHETGAMGWISCDQEPVPSPCHQPNQNPLPAGVHTFKAVAVDSAGDTGTSIMTVTVKGQPEPPVVTWPDAVIEVYEGYEKLSISVSAESPVEGRTITSATLYRNGVLVRKDTRSPWNWGHSFAPYEFGAMGWLDRHEPNPEPLGVGTHTFKVVAEDNTGLQGEAYMTLIVKELPAPTINFVESDIELLTDYQTLSVSVDVTTGGPTVDVVSVGLYLDDVLIREQFEAPFTWGGEFYESELLGLEAGDYTLKAVVTDSNGKMSEASIFISIDLFGDLDKDGDVDGQDIRTFALAVRAGESLDLRYDFNNDGVVNNRDTSGMARLCSNARCASNGR